MTPVVEIEGLTKAFAGVQALSAGSLSILPGEVHGLVGENGAGKSTLIKILAGAQSRDGGVIRVDGEPTRFHSERDADMLGLRFIHQDVGVVDRMTVAENLFLGRRLPKRGPFISQSKARREAREILEGFADVDPAARLVKLSIAERWMVGLARTCHGSARLIVMDEPTVALSDTEVELVFTAIDRLKADGIAVLFVSHRLSEVLRISDRVTVMKDGATVGTHAIADLDHARLVKHIVGELVGGQNPNLAGVSPVAGQNPNLSGVPPVAGNVVLEARGLQGGPLTDIDLKVRSGEVLGIAGLVGSGRTSLLSNLFGAHRPTGGTLLMDGREVEFRVPTDAVKRGIAMIPEERRAQGLLLRRSVRENIVITHLRRFRWTKRLPMPLRSRETAAAREQMSSLRIAASGPEQRVANLSGGNQQKTLLARWLVGDDLRVLLLDEPTKGIDVGAKGELFRIVRGLADEGVAVVLVSSDLEEVGTHSDRIVVLSEGRVVGEIDGPAAESEILDLCYAAKASA